MSGSITLRSILVVDDHDVVRDGIRNIIGREFETVKVIEATSAEEAMTTFQESPTDIVLADINMSGQTGIELIKKLHQILPSLPVIILTAFPESEYGAEALKFGAAGFIAKTNVNSELPLAIKMALNGGKYISPRLTEALTNYLGNNYSQTLHESLSTREMTVLKLIAKGLPTREIATSLKLGEKTIATYRRRIYAKLNVSSIVEIVRYAFKHNLVEDEER